MSIHGLVDRVAVSLGARFMPKYFREAADSPPVREHLRAVKLSMPEIRGAGQYEVTATSLAGELDAAFRLVKDMDETLHTIIYHHGAGEIPFDYGFKRVFPLKNSRANMFLVRAPFHRSMGQFMHGIRALANVAAMLAVSVSLIEELVKYARSTNSTRILVTGTSLGGFVANLHHIHHNSADVYTPLLAGLAMDDAYLKSIYSKAVAKEAKQNPAAVEAVLNFEDGFASRDTSNVFPLLARHDQLIRYEVQKLSYGDCPVETIDKGHATGALAYDNLRLHVLRHLEANEKGGS